MAKTHKKMEQTFGLYAMPTVKLLNINIEYGFASSIEDAFEDDYGVIG